MQERPMPRPAQQIAGDYAQALRQSSLEGNNVNLERVISLLEPTATFGLEKSQKRALEESLLRIRGEFGNNPDQLLIAQTVFYSSLLLSRYNDLASAYNKVQEPEIANAMSAFERFVEGKAQPAELEVFYSVSSTARNSLRNQALDTVDLVQQVFTFSQILLGQPQNINNVLTCVKEAIKTLDIQPTPVEYISEIITSAPDNEALEERLKILLQDGVGIKVSKLISIMHTPLFADDSFQQLDAHLETGDIKRILPAFLTRIKERVSLIQHKVLIGELAERGQRDRLFESVSQTIVRTVYATILLAIAQSGEGINGANSAIKPTKTLDQDKIPSLEDVQTLIQTQLTQNPPEKDRTFPTIVIQYAYEIAREFIKFRTDDFKDEPPPPAPPPPDFPPRPWRRPGGLDPTRFGGA